MIFCGRCGYQLAPGDTACPRCGTPVEPEMLPEDYDSHADQPTIASGASSLYQPGPAQPNTQGPTRAPTPQQPLILGPAESAYAPGEQLASEPTSMMGTQPYGTGGPSPAYPPGTREAYPGYVQQGGSYPGFPPQRASGTAYPPITGTYGTPSAETARIRERGRVVALLLILLGLLLIIGAMVLYLVTRNTSPPSQQAQALTQQFYVEATGDALSGSGTKISTHQGSYIVRQENGTWKILSGNLSPV